MRKIQRNKLYFPSKLLLRSAEIIISNEIFDGSSLELFERSFARYLGVKHAIAVCSGKHALWLCLQALGIKQNGLVVVSDFNVPEVPALIEAIGMTPALVDINRHTWNLDLNSLKTQLSEGARCIIATHMFGVPIDMEALMSCARSYGAVVIEDACQAVGATFGGRRVGGWGDIGFFSFGTLKIMSTLNGGMIATNDDKYAAIIREKLQSCPYPNRWELFKQLFKTALIKAFTSQVFFDGLVFPLFLLMDNFNKDFKYSIMKGKEISQITRSSLKKIGKKMCNLQAILGLEVLPLLDDIISSCIKKSDYLAGALNKAHIGFQHVPHGARPSYFKYAIRMPDRKRILDFLFRQGIDVTFGYMQACSNLRNLAKFSKGCPESFLLDAEHLYLPIHSCHSVADMDYIVRTLVCARERLPL